MKSGILIDRDQTITEKPENWCHRNPAQVRQLLRVNFLVNLRVKMMITSHIFGTPYVLVCEEIQSI